MKKLLLIILPVMCAACATSPEAPTEGAATQSADNPLQLTALTESALPHGKCGMILWTLEADQPTPILRYIVGDRGEIAINGAPAVLDLQEALGASSFGVSENQTFTSDDGLSAAVSFRFGLGFDGGSYLERGLVTVEADNGWRLVAPAAGIAGCRN